MVPVRRDHRRRRDRSRGPTPGAASPSDESSLALALVHTAPPAWPSLAQRPRPNALTLTRGAPCRVERGWARRRVQRRVGPRRALLRAQAARVSEIALL